jgi:hypothetical protein
MTAGRSEQRPYGRQLQGCRAGGVTERLPAPKRLERPLQNQERARRAVPLRKTIARQEGSLVRKAGSG